MRKFIIPLLLASVAASPVMAQSSDARTRASEEREERKKEREKRQEQVREERQAPEPRLERQQAPEQRHQRQQATEPRHERQQIQVERANTDRGDRPDRARQPSNDAPAATQQIDRQRFERRQEERQQAGRQRSEQRADQLAGQPGRDVRQRVDARRQQWDEQRAERIARQAEIRNRRPPVISPTPQPGTQPPPPAVVRPATNPQVNWSTNHWRKDRRYDWYKYRNKYWWLFQLGWYSDPFGWGYQPYGIGWRMWPSYYSSHYWLNDPWQYRLPYPPPGTRWIRYWDDAILVDTWSGQVVDVIYNFFW